MFWQEDEDKTLPWQAPDDIIDISFAISCKQIPLDHSWALSTAIRKHLPWIGQDRCSGVHSIHVAGDANGWLRPEDGSEQLLIPSKRTRILLRLPKERLPETLQLKGETLSISGHPLTIGQGKERTLLNAPVIFARYVLADANKSESEFLQRMVLEIKDIAGFNVKKMMCGKSHYLQTPNGPHFTRHLMIADLDNETSIKIQQYGLGEGREFGCGLFLPHKGIKTLKPTE